MWIVYELASLEIIGMTGHGARELPRDKAVSCFLAGKTDGDAAKYGALQVTDTARAHEIMSAYPDRVVLTASSKNPELIIRPIQVFYLQLASDAPDVHPADGIKEIAADGEATTQITVQKVDDALGPVSHKEHGDELFLRTDYGVLLDASGKRDISRLKLKNGKAAFRLRSETARRVATVRVFNADPALRDATIQIEFI
jgi:hypothetical protein